MERKRIVVAGSAQYELWQVDGGYILKRIPGSRNAVGTFEPSGAAVSVALGPEDQAIIDGTADISAYEAKFGG